MWREKLLSAIQELKRYLIVVSNVSTLTRTTGGRWGGGMEIENFFLKLMKTQARHRHSNLQVNFELN